MLAAQSSPSTLHQQANTSGETREGLLRDQVPASSVVNVGTPTRGAAAVLPAWIPNRNPQDVVDFTGFNANNVSGSSSSEAGDNPQ